MTSSNSNPPILTVSQLTNAIKMSLESTFPLIWIQGEVSNCKLQSSGHLYFSIKDANAQISVVMFKADVSGLKKNPKDGDHVILKGGINVYPPSGKYQLIAKELRFMGLGELLLKLEELKIKLHQKGWFKAEHKKLIPKIPFRIGVVTSPTGAVIQDIVNVLTRRFKGFHLILYPVKVQGDGAAQEIAQAINEFNRYALVDVMIVGRGGGSIEDLWAFNEEIVAQAIFDSQIPIISAVGHETDHCIADYVADLRAPTPSAAAELVIVEKAQQILQVVQIQRRIQHSFAQCAKQYRHQLERILKHPILMSPQLLLAPWMQKMDDLREDIDQSIKRTLQHQLVLIESHKKQLHALKPTNQLLYFKQKLIQLQKSLQISISQKMGSLKNLLVQRKEGLTTAWIAGQGNRRRLFVAVSRSRQIDQFWNRMFTLRKERLESLCLSLHSIDPKNLLTKGYSILFSEKDNSVITSIAAVKKNQNIKVLVSDGTILSTVKDIYLN